MAVDFGGKHLQFWSHGFVCQMKMVNACGHIPVCDLTMAYSVNSKRRTLIRGKSKHESFRGSILDSIIAECKRKLSVEVFGASTNLVESETPNCEQQAVPAKSARRNECDHVHSAFQFDKQSHVTKIVNIWCPNQLSLCFSSSNEFLTTVMPCHSQSKQNSIWFCYMIHHDNTFQCCHTLPHVKPKLSGVFIGFKAFCPSKVCHIKTIFWHAILHC